MIDTPVEDDRGTVSSGARARRGESSRSVGFTYPTRTEPALDGDRAADPARARRVALVGRSGGGKTTLVNLLPRFYSPDQRAASCSTATTCRTLTLESLRANIALVSQEVVLFNDSIYANIAYGRDGRRRAKPR